MKRGVVLGSLLLAVVVLGGCVSGAPSGSSSGGGARCLSRPDTSGTQPLFYLICIQSG